MNRRTFFVLCAAAAGLCGCQSSKVRISGRFVGSETRNVYLEEVTPLRQTLVDSTQLSDDGSYRFQLREGSETPALYNVIYDGEYIPLLLAGGDRVEVNAAGSLVRNYTVKGSEESELLRGFYQAFVAGAQRLDEIAQQFAAGETLSEEQRQALMKQYADEYFRIRREQLRFIVENPASLAAVYALYQRLPGDTYLFNGDSDVVYYRKVAEEAGQKYPGSPYVQSLQAEVARMDARINLTSKITEMSYPDLEMTDMFGKKVRLSSLAGKVILLGSLPDCATLQALTQRFALLPASDNLVLTERTGEQNAIIAVETQGKEGVLITDGKRKDVLSGRTLDGSVSVRPYEVLVLVKE